MKAFKIHLIRHGQTSANEEAKIIGKTDTPLSERGREELRTLAKAEIYPYVERLYASPAGRCLQTGEIIFPDVDIRKVEDLREIDFGVYEDLPLASLTENEEFMRSFLAATKEEKTIAFEGGESFAEFEKRAKNGLFLIINDMLKDGVFSAGIITHAGIMSFLTSEFALPKKAPAEWQFYPGEGISLILHPALWNNSKLLEIYSLISPNEVQARELDEDAYLDYAEGLLKDSDLKPQ